MRDRHQQGKTPYPGYDVLDKRTSPSWNEQTRRVVARRIAVDPEPQFFTPEEFRTVLAIAARIVPQPEGRAPIPVAALVDLRLRLGVLDGYRGAGMPRDGDAWRQGLKALQAEAAIACGKRFEDLPDEAQDLLLQRMEKGELSAPDWGRMSSKTFFQKRMARDLVLAYYAHPTAWSEIGWGGPASPRGYVRLDFDERDPWEAAEAKGGDEASVREINRNVR